MDLRFTPEQTAWRAEVRDFLVQQLPSDIPAEFDEGSDEIWGLSRRLTKALAARGWLGVGWPREYGGMGAGHLAQMIFNEELGYHRAPDPGGIGIRFIGPALIVLGTEEQKQRYLPGIIRGDDVWCQGFSEPGSGSDLASLQTRAIADGDDFIVSGSKIWTSHAHRSNYCYLATRTNPDAPKHRGITLMAMDMDSPGVTLRPLINMAGQHGFNELFLDNVRVPKANVIGEVDRGWYAMATTLDFERSGIQGVARTRRDLEELQRYVQETGRDAVPLAARRALVERVIENEVGRAMAYRIVDMQARGLVPNQEASCTKLFNAEVSQRVAATGLKLLGLFGGLRPETPRARLHGHFAITYLGSVVASIAGGTNEIQRQIIATRGLGLPRG